MRFGMFRYNGRSFPGLVCEGQVLDLSTAGFADLQEMIASEALHRSDFGECPMIPIGKVETLPPLSRPGKIICIGKNYMEHVKETGWDSPGEPVFFAKFATSIIGTGGTVFLPKVSAQVDYEAELAVIIGRRGKNISEINAMTYVAGYTVFNDISARDLQFRDGQWMKGKALDTFAPMGPYIVTPEEVGDPHALDIRLSLNGELMQSSNTALMIFKVPQLIGYLSQLFTLEPGDVISTGTPSGVGFARVPPIFLQAGDTMEISIDKVGTLVNDVEDGE